MVKDGPTTGRPPCDIVTYGESASYLSQIYDAAMKREPVKIEAIGGVIE